MFTSKCFYKTQLLFCSLESFGANCNMIISKYYNHYSKTNTLMKRLKLVDRMAIKPCNKSQIVLVNSYETNLSETNLRVYV